MLLTVGRIGRAHGVRGEVTVEVRTDQPEERFEIGTVLITDPSDRGPLVVESARWNNATLLLAFRGKTDRSAVEALRNTVLLAEVDVNQPREENEFHIAQIVGCVAYDEAGNEVGPVIDVLALPGADTLVIQSAKGELLVPFVTHHVPKLKLEEKRIELANMEGLL